jgi:hypothetical protein
MTVLAVWVLFVCIRIEVLNARADNWLSQPEAHDPDAGKWRVSKSGDLPRDELREWVRGFGVLQYVLGPCAILFSLAAAFSRIPRWQRSVACLLCATSIAVVAMTFYRGYLSALGG